MWKMKELDIRVLYIIVLMFNVICYAFFAGGTVNVISFIATREYDGSIRESYDSSWGFSIY